MKMTASAQLTQAVQLINDNKPLECLQILDQLAADFAGVSAFHTLRGMALGQMHEHELAVKHFTEAIKLDPIDPLPYVMIGSSLSKNLQHDEAEKYFKLALVLDPDQVDALSGVGLAAFHRLEYAEAESNFLRALKHSPNNPGLLTNLGGLYLVQGVYDKALKHLDKAIRLESGNQVARTNRALLKLGMGDFATAWDDYEYRWSSANLMAKRFQNLKEWEGPSGPETAVLIWTEQGLGDEIMFASIFPELEKLKQKFIIECDSRLYGIFSESFPRLTFVPKNSITDTGPVDYQIPLANLGRLFRRSRSAFPKYPQGYLKIPDAPLPDETLEALDKLPRPWIGVSWESYAQVQNFRGRKSIPASEFSNLTSTPGATFINLQFPNPHKHELAKGVIQEIPDRVVSLPGIHLKNDVAKIARLMTQLDHVVTIGNSLAHFCGAFGIPATVLLPSVPDWRWARRDEDFVWYQCLSFMRNRSLENWAEPLHKVREELVGRFVKPASNDASGR
jgi:Flp pilus assembly protein TadD